MRGIGVHCNSPAVEEIERCSLDMEVKTEGVLKVDSRLKDKTVNDAGWVSLGAHGKRANLKPLQRFGEASRKNSQYTTREPYASSSKMK